MARRKPGSDATSPLASPTTPCVISPSMTACSNRISRGLQLAGDEGWELAVDGLKWEEPGEVFVAAILAFESRDQAKIDRVLETVGESVELRRALISALGWLSWVQAEPFATRYAESEDPFMRYAGAAAFDTHRQDPGRPLGVLVGRRRSRGESQND